MADVIKKATNKFTKGLIMDFSPENTRNEVLTHALNATLLTFNGNELSLQNDMGNARVETAFLPDGYIPVGTCEYGGILYIVSYNPLEDRSQIGCFPSPERNISSKELGISDKEIDRSLFLHFIRNEQGELVPDGTILHTSLYVLLKNDNLNPGDKFLITASPQIYNEKIQDLLVDASTDGEDNFVPVENPIIALNVVSIEDSGKIVYLNSDIRLYTTEIQDVSSNTSRKYQYHILGKMDKNESGGYDLALTDIDSYRNVLSSGYSVFKSKTSGKLAILAELITIDSYSVTHNIQPKKENGSIIEGSFDVMIYPEVSPIPPNVVNNTVPKLKYYYLDKSQGYIQTDVELVPLFKVVDDKITNKINPKFKTTKLSSIYEPTTEVQLNLNTTLDKSGSFNFPKAGSYHGRMLPYEYPANGTISEQIYTLFLEGKYHKVSKSQIVTNDNYEEFNNFYIDELNAKFYYYSAEGNQYQKYEEETIEESYTYYVIKKNNIYEDAQRNKDYIEYDLYKLESVPLAATEDEIYDSTIEKYQYVDIHTYRVATEENLTDGSTLYEETSEGVYSTITGFPDKNKKYYVLKTEQNLKSIGFTFNWEDYPGEIYYYPMEKLYILATKDDINTYYDFETYPLTNNAPYGSSITLYVIRTTDSYELATDYQVYNHKELGITLYYDTNYILIAPNLMQYYTETMGLLFMVVPMDLYVSNAKFVPSKLYNYIYGDTSYSSDYEKDDPIYLYKVADFLPTAAEQDDENLQYNALKFANIKIPRTVTANDLDLPFKYDYSLVPCMNYGKLEHLKVSNTIDFGKLHAFNLSDFTVWKYRIDENQLRLTFGAEVFDTYETDKVDGLILEFYDVWGFAGSIEITDKKAYSGLFTKIINLNSLGAISNRKVANGNYSDKYKHNVNILEDLNNTGKFLLNGKLVTYSNYASGWKYSKTSDGEFENDCGTLYTNVLYGVKTYLRRTVNGSKEFIKKKEFFLYTLPLFNDYYYTHDYFDTIEYPQLDLILTYKLTDTSTRSNYNNASTIVEGYSSLDKDLVGLYLSGFFDGTNLDVIKYYKYSGTSNLFVEIGLRKEYDDINLRYDNTINSLFTCKLKLVSDDDVSKSFNVHSGQEDFSNESAILNYPTADDTINSSLNYVQFLNGTQEHAFDPLTFLHSNFIYSNGSDPVKIKYEFVVGYKAAITNIRTTEVSATTVCALFHKQNNGEYNYNDFNLDTADTTTYLENSIVNSNLLFFNRGTADKEVVGVGSLSEGVNNFSVTSSVESEALDITIPGKLNTGDKMKLLTSLIGKLTFCQPHAHYVYSTESVNILDGTIKNAEGALANYECRPYDMGSSGFNLYNMCLNTKNMIMHNSEFISTLLFKAVTNVSNEPTARRFTGIEKHEIQEFNKKMLTTMSKVYAYNPDYDKLSVNVGTINDLSYSPYFTSNIVSVDSLLNFKDNKTFNDYIYLGPIVFSKYLRYLNNFSVGSDGLGITTYLDDKAISLVQLTPSLTYCGTSEAPYLVSSLTYNTPIPDDLKLELEFSSGNLVVVKHYDGTNSFVQGQINRKALYGYVPEYQKLVQYDVTNYEIEDSGKIKFTKVSSNETKTGTYTYNNGIYFGLGFNYDFKGASGDLSSITVHIGGSCYTYPDSNFNKKTYIPNPKKGAEGEFIVIVDSSLEKNTFYFSIGITTYKGQSGYSYNISLDKLTAECKGRRLNPNKVSVSTLQNKSFDELKTIIYSDSTYWLSSTDKDTKIQYRRSGGMSLLSNGLRSTANLANSKIYSGDSWGFIISDGHSEAPSLGIELYYIKFTSVDFNITRKSALEVCSDGVISVSRKTGYSYIDDHVYKLKSDYENTCLIGTSITLNDLLYEPNKDEHRLFMRIDNCVYDDYLGGKIYYRTLNGGAQHSSWAKSSQNKNALFLYTGPCFV